MNVRMIQGTDVMHPQFGANGTCKKSWFGQNFF